MKGGKKTDLAACGFALVSTLSLFILILTIAIGMLSLATISLRTTGMEEHQQRARANARLALQLAIADLQRYAGPDQRVTGRADLLDPTWTDASPQVTNPFYTCVWDVSGSEMSHSWDGTYGNPLKTETSAHRAGMDPGHDFTKVPAILVSGNSGFDLTNDKGVFTKTSYPAGYVKADSATGGFVSIVPAESMLGDTENANQPPPVRVPLVSIEGKGKYAFWVGDESVKNRINIGNRHDPSSTPARFLAQRSVIEPFRSDQPKTPDASAPYQKILTVPSTSIVFPDQVGTGWSYSPDLTADSRSLIVDVRSGGLKDDMTYALYNPQTTPGMPDEFKDLAPMFDSINGRIWGWEDGVDIPKNGGISPFFQYLRDYAAIDGSQGAALSIGQDDITPVISQVQAAIHAAYKIVPPTSFKVYYSVFPSVTLWNPYNVPIRLDKDISVSLERRSSGKNWWLNLFKANYSIENADGSIGVTVNNVFNAASSSRCGWNFRMVIPADSTTVIDPGQAMVFSPTQTTLRDDPIASGAPNSNTRTSLSIEMKPGWRPGKGHIFNLDDRVHDATTFNPTGNSFPRISFGLGGIITSNNLLWSAHYWNTPSSPKLMSYWSRLTSKVTDSSPFFDPPLTTDTNQDSRGSFPGLLYKHALRMGDDFLSLPSLYIHPAQKTLLFPYTASLNPRAIYHAAIGANYGMSVTSSATGFFSSEGTECSSTLMGGLYDYQSSRTIYSVPTTDSAEILTYIGSDYVGGTQKMILVETPTLSMKSLPNGASASLVSFTQLNHSRLTQGNDAPHPQIRYEWMGTATNPTYPIGNSLADYRLNVDQKATPLPSTNPTVLTHFGSIAKYDRQGSEAECSQYDLSYLLNDRFYDHYFLSTIPQSGTYDKNSPLINSRIAPQTDEIADLRNIKSAKNLLLEGGFNVNSTSVAAWELLLSSSLGVDRPGVSASEATFANRIDSDGTATSASITMDDACSGGKNFRLTPEEVRNLAEAIVAQVKRRGPFPSVAAFVNRTNRLQDLLRPDANNSLPANNIDVRYSGAIQAAIDSLALNDSVESKKTIDPGDYVSDNRFYPGTNSLKKSPYAGLPGLLKQSDILRQVDSQITVRGDTFVIRALGTSEDKAGNTVAKVACEAIVQRTIEYMDPADPAEKAPYLINKNPDGTLSFTNNLLEPNQRFGRRFQIQSFRWLPSSEVSAMAIK